MDRWDHAADRLLFCSVRSPLALGLLLLVSPAAGAAELNLADLNQYARDAGTTGAEQVTSINQFSDVRPTDWAYQALINLIERYGCVAGYPNGSFKGGQAMTRYEAAALLNACLDRVTEVTDELKRLMAEFEKELAVLRGRVDGLEARVGELEANQFSTTTKLSGVATFVVGSNGFGSTSAGLADQVRAEAGGTTFNYDLRLFLDTSFNGRDLLHTTLRAGNFADSVFGGAGPTGSLSNLEVAFEEDCGTGADCGDVLAIDELYYRLPLGLGFTATLGARWGQEDMFALWPSVYPADTVLNVMAANGAPAAYNKNIGPGVGLWWQQNGWSASALYVAANGDQADTAEGGLGSATAAATAALQLGYAGEQWALAAIYSRIQAGVSVPGTTPFTAAEFLADAGSHTDAFGLSGYWQPAGSGWMPSISAGWGLNATTYDSPRSSGSLATSQSWMVGLQWSDVLARGNQLGMGVGQPVFATALRDGGVPHDQGYVWEWWYKLQLTDQITVTPALFYLSRPLGQETPSGEGLDQLGALIKTSFQF